MSESLIPPSFLFRFSAPCLYHPLEWSGKGLQLGEEYRLPSFAELDQRKPYADVRAAWSERGVGFSVLVTGKRQPPWCRETQFDDSDGLHIWIDTRDTHNIHRAGRFCHRFGFLPTGGGSRREEPVAGQLLINRAREHPKPAMPSQLLVRTQTNVDGYLLETLIAASALTGYDPADHGKLGFMYAVYDRELGEQTFGPGSEFPYAEDPSVWNTLELVRQK